MTDDAELRLLPPDALMVTEVRTGVGTVMTLAGASEAVVLCARGRNAAGEPVETTIVLPREGALQVAGRLTAQVANLLRETGT